MRRHLWKHEHFPKLIVLGLHFNILKEGRWVIPRHKSQKIPPRASHASARSQESEKTGCNLLRKCLLSPLILHHFPFSCVKIAFYILYQKTKTRNSPSFSSTNILQAYHLLHTHSPKKKKVKTHSNINREKKKTHDPRNWERCRLTLTSEKNSLVDKALL